MRPKNITHIHASWGLRKLGYRVEIGYSKNRPTWSVYYNETDLVGIYSSTNSILTLYRRVAKRRRVEVDNPYEFEEQYRSGHLALLT